MDNDGGGCLIYRRHLFIYSDRFSVYLKEFGEFFLESKKNRLAFFIMNMDFKPRTKCEWICMQKLL